MQKGRGVRSQACWPIHSSLDSVAVGGPSLRSLGWGGASCGQLAIRRPGRVHALLTTKPCPGLLCHLNDACISNPCNEGSNCDTNPVNGKAICTCPSGYTGPACIQDVDECALGTKQAGGQTGTGIW